MLRFVFYSYIKIFLLGLFSDSKEMIIIFLFLIYPMNIMYCPHKFPYIELFLYFHENLNVVIADFPYQSAKDVHSLLYLICSS